VQTSRLGGIDLELPAKGEDVQLVPLAVHQVNGAGQHLVLLLARPGVVDGQLPGHLLFVCQPRLAGQQVQAFGVEMVAGGSRPDEDIQARGTRR
jgi:hypothetical protein